MADLLFNAFSLDNNKINQFPESYKHHIIIVSLLPSMLQSPHLWLEAPLPGSPTDEASRICLIQLLGFSIYEH
jgi:hypothetical protein